MPIFQPLPIYSLHVRARAPVHVATANPLRAWWDTARLLSPWWISKRRCFKILLRHTSPFPACCRKRGGASLMYRSSRDRLCVCSQYEKVWFFMFVFFFPTNAPTKRNGRGFFCMLRAKASRAMKGKQQESFCLHIQNTTGLGSHRCVSRCRALAEPFAAIKPCKLIA